MNKRSLQVGPLAESEPAFTGHNYLLVIGINAYEHCPRLHNAVKDAQDLVQVLQQTYGFEAERTFTLYDEAATEHNIHYAFEQLADQVREQDNVLIYFSGHGHLDRKWDMGYWVPVNARHETTADYIANSQIITFLKGIKARHTFLVSDSCFSGSLFYQGRALHTRLAGMPSRWGLTSGREEIVNDGKPGDNSPFAKALLTYLKNQPDEQLRVSELIRYVEEITANNSEQTPIGNRIQQVGDQGGEFIFRRGKGGNPTVETHLDSPRQEVGNSQRPFAAAFKARRPLPTSWLIGMGGGLLLVLGLLWFAPWRKQLPKENPKPNVPLASQDSQALAKPDSASLQAAAKPQAEKPVETRPGPQAPSRPRVPLLKPIKLQSPQSWSLSMGDYELTQSMGLIMGSSILEEPTYADGQAWDGNPRTAWMPEKNQKGEYLDLYFESEKGYRIEGMAIMNGFHESPKAWKQHARVKTLSYWHEEKLLARIALPNRPDIAIIRLPKVPLLAGKRTFIRLRVEAIYPGEADKPLAISEVLFR